MPLFRYLSLVAIPPSCLLRAAALLACLQAPAVAAYYGTSWDESRWAVSRAPLKCELRHAITGFGEARIERHAGGGDQLIITSSKSLLQPASFRIDARPPMWRHEQNATYLGQVDGGKDIRLQGARLRDVIAQLHQRKHVDFVREGAATDTPSANAGASSGRRFAVSLTPQNFSPAYADYVQCVSKMIPYSFAQIASHTYRYGADASDLPSATQRQLDKMLRYSEADKRVVGFIVDAHSHAEDDAAVSVAQAQFQADLIADYLQNAGFSDARILRRVHGDKFPIASNATEAGQARNRRVTVRLEDENLRRARQAKIAARERQELLDKERTLAAEAKAQALDVERVAAEAAAESARESYLDTARAAMHGSAGAAAGGQDIIIRKSKPGISIEEIERLVEGQSLSEPRQPRIEIKLD